MTTTTDRRTTIALFYCDDCEAYVPAERVDTVARTHTLESDVPTLYGPDRAHEDVHPVEPTPCADLTCTAEPTIGWSVLPHDVVCDTHARHLDRNADAQPLDVLA